ncbi:MAG: decaprenyl-phosphate phosphoribosyltransferase [Thermosynechococcaceae cyanobacterium]
MVQSRLKVKEGAAAPSRETAWLHYLAALRPRQWTKNLIVFAAPLFGFSINLDSFLHSALAFAVFCCASSSFYLLNDVADVESDRRHPVKCNRPIAAGLVTVPMAIAISTLLLSGALWFAWQQSMGLGAALTGYAVLQVLYNLKLKRVVILDILAIATGFILRAVAGAAATGIFLSSWFLLCTAMLALFLGIEKRKAELRLVALHGGKTRAVLNHYSIPLLIRMESMVSTGAVMSYVLWSSGPVLQGASTPWMMLTSPFVLYGIFRYQLLSDQSSRVRSDTEGEDEKTERPEDVLLKDRPVFLTVLLWGVTVFAILWLQNHGVIQ